MSELRDKLRAATLGAPAIRASKLVRWNGVEVELRRPSLKDQRTIEQLSSDKRGKQDSTKALVHALIRCVYVPGTEERVFEAADVEAMENRGAEDFVGVFAMALGELAKDVDPEAIEKNSEGSQTAAA